MDRLNDPALMSLPHPARLDAATGQPADILTFEQMGVLEALRPYLADEHASTEWIINTVPGLRELALRHFGVAAGGNLGSFMLLLTRARLRAHGDPILQVTPALQSMLGETDLGTDLPSRFFRSPYTLAYIEFARPNPFQVPNQHSGLHECEGVYVGTYELGAHHEIYHQAARNQALKLDPSKPIRIVELVITGSPIGKEHALDDASQDLMLFIQDEDECLQTLLERHIAFFNTPQAYSHPGLAPMNPQEVGMTEPVIFELAKVLLYLNLSDARQHPFEERSDLERRIKGLGPKKAAKLRRKLGGAYDRIIVGPEELPQSTEPGQSGSAGDHARSVRPHWRRGHFRRIRFGEKLSESRVGWIPPTLVNAEGAFQQVKTKPYKVR